MRASLVCFFVSFLAACSSEAAPGTGEIRGRAVVSGTSQGLAGVSVSVQGENRTTASLPDGAFFLVGVAPGPRLVECAKMGYRSVQVSIQVAAGQVSHVRCEMVGAALAPPAVASAHATAAPVYAAARVSGGSDVDDILGALDGKAAAARESEKKLERSSRPASPASLGTLAGVGYGAGQGAAVVDSLRGGRAEAAQSPGHGRARAYEVHAAPPARPMALVAREPPYAEPSREGYEGIDENAFLGARETPLSTFSIDVDTASYANVRRFLREGRLPPRDAVRIEELINYFRYDDPDPAAGQPFSVRTEVSTAPWQPSHELVRIGLQGRRIPAASLPPANLTFLIDVSGSMRQPNKLPLLKASFRLLVAELRPQDRVAMVTYAGRAGVALPPTPGSEKGVILEALDALDAGGSTAGAEGIRTAYDLARQSFRKGGNNRVVLATDGDFNVGTSSDGELVQLIEHERKSGVFLTVLGFGTGNYQDAKMQKLADAGNGNHAYIDDLDEARKTLVGELGATLNTIAKDVKLQVEFNPARVKAYRLIGYENRRLADRDFNDDTKDAGEMGAGHAVTALYEIVPAGSSEEVPGVDPLKYQAVAPTAAADDGELLTVKIRWKAPDGDKSQLLTQAASGQVTPLAETSVDFRFASAVAELGLLLRTSPHRGNASYDAVLSRARGALGRDAGGLRSGFLELVTRAQALSGNAIAR